MRKKNDQLTANTMITKEQFDQLFGTLKTDYAINNFGHLTKHWFWLNSSQCCEYVETEFEHPEKGCHRVQWWLSIEDGWKMGYPPFAGKEKLCLYNEHLLTDQTENILLVEGLSGLEYESKRFVGDPECRYLVMSFGQVSQIERRRWSTLQDKKSINIVIWPNLTRESNRDGSERLKTNQSSFRAALDIQEKIVSWAKILDPFEFDDNNELREGFGFGYCVENDLDITKFLRQCPYYDAKRDREKRLAHGMGYMPFKFLGYDLKNFYFLTGRSSSSFSLPRKNIGNYALFNLAPLDWWIDHFPGGRSVDWNAAIDWVITESMAKGYVANNKFRRAGFWKDKDNFYCNTGRELITPSGAKIPYSKVESEYCYVQSMVTIDHTDGECATDEQGAELIKLFESQHFKNRLQAWEAAGWSVMAPFFSMLPRRPLMWLTGASMSGKSWLIENVMMPLAGELAFSGTPKTTDSQFKHQLGTDNRVAYFDEMETRSKNNKSNLELIESKIQMARDSTSNSSNRISHTGKDGEPVTFEINSAICFSSVIPYLDSAPLESRFLCPELQAVSNEKDRKEKQSKCFKILQSGLLDDPKIFMRRIFKNIEQVMRNVEWLRKEIASILEDQRKADNYAPIFAGIFALTNQGEITTDFYSLIGEMLADIKDKKVDTDEESLINAIMESAIETETGKKKALAELVHSALSIVADAHIYNSSMARFGVYYDNVSDCLAIATNNSYLRNLLLSTPYSVKYGDVLCRHPKINRDAGATRNLFFAGSRKKCVLFKREVFLEILNGGS